MNILRGSFKKKPSNKPKVTYEQAVEVAKHLSRHQNVRDVLLFGSVARDKIGQDIDIIIVTDFERARQFLTIIDIVLPPRVYMHKQMRQEIASDVLEGSFEALFAWVEKRMGVDLDILVFPPDWRKHLEEIGRALHAEPLFMQNLVAEAVSLIKDT